MASRANTILFLSVAAVIVGYSLAKNPRCQGGCQRIAQDIFTYGLKGLFHPFRI